MKSHHDMRHHHEVHGMKSHHDMRHRHHGMRYRPHGMRHRHHDMRRRHHGMSPDDPPVREDKELYIRASVIYSGCSSSTSFYTISDF